MHTGFIGAGRTACSIGKYLAISGKTVEGYYDISKEAADSAAAFTDSRSFAALSDLTAKCGLLFLTTPDRLIKETWEQIHLLPLQNKIICHCSGAMSSSVFTGIEQTKASGCSFHPMLPFSSRFTSYMQLKNAFFTIEGQDTAVQTVTAIFEELGNTVCRISGSCKPKYHAAASILSNQAAAVLDTGYRLLEECGFTREAAIQATEGLIRQNIGNILREDCVQALTGPIERNDTVTVQKHLDCLNDEDKAMYRVLGKKLVRIAEKKNPKQDYTAMKQLL